MTDALEARPRTRRQAAWILAKRDTRLSEGDIWSWWITMRVAGRLGSSQLSLGEQLRYHNATQVAPLPCSFGA